MQKSWIKVKNRLFSTFFDDFLIFSNLFQHIFFNFFESVQFGRLDVQYWRPGTKQILSFWWKFTFLDGFASREESATSKKCSIFKIFCILRFSLWWPNHYGKWLFTKEIKFCLVPGDPKNVKKSWKKYVEKKVENRQKMLKIGDFQHFFNFFFNIFFQLFFPFLGYLWTK